MEKPSTPTKSALTISNRFFRRSKSEEYQQEHTAVAETDSNEDAQSAPLSVPESDLAAQEASLHGRKLALGVLARHTFQEARRARLICDIVNDCMTERKALQCVALKTSRGNYATFPQNSTDIELWVANLCCLNVGAAMTLTSSVTQGIVNMIPPGASEVAISASSRIQVLPNISDLAKARKAQGAAFIISEMCVIVWSDVAKFLLSNAQDLHQQLAQFLWDLAGTNTTDSNNYFSLTSISSGLSWSATPGGHSSLESPLSPSGTSQMSGAENNTGGSINSSFGSRDLVVFATANYGDSDTAEKGLENDYEERPTALLSPIVHAFAFALAALICVLQVRTCLEWSLLDGQWLRMASALLCPLFFIIVMFLCDNIFSTLLMLFGPIRQLQQNSRYYSGIRPERLHRITKNLPHITVQMPVYKESLEHVLKPSFESIKLAISTYELQGGTASIIVSEDGIALLDDQNERSARTEYYEDNNITWIGRPKHGKDGFVREGRFKKASNLNFTYDVILKAEELFRQKKALSGQVEQGDPDTSYPYNDCLQEVLSSIHPDACGSGQNQFGDYILLVDCDTRVPVDCFLDAATEMTRSKDVGILQHCSGVMIVSTSFFERCIAYFTRLVNFSISFTIAGGDVAPFMGHNAYLRWSALKEIAHIEKLATGREQIKIWSENHVSEDFVMALDMIELGYITRWATYSNSEYLEGVSLTCNDEINRWQKYSWGVSEMIFNPLKHWYRGPISPLIRRFLWGKAPIHYKWASGSYCFSYHAIALAFPMTAGMTLVQGWLGPDSVLPYIPCFQVLVSCLIVYLVGGTLGLGIARFRAGLGGILPLLWENIKHLPFLVLFFGGLSYHISAALISHLIGINMSWGSTLKDIDLTNFFVEGPMVLKRHYRPLLLSFVLLGGMAILNLNILPLEWNISGVFVVLPFYFAYSLHVLFLFFLNPNLVRFSF